MKIKFIGKLFWSAGSLYIGCPGVFIKSWKDGASILSLNADKLLGKRTAKTIKVVLIYFDSFYQFVTQSYI